MVRYITLNNYLLSFLVRLWRCRLCNCNVTVCFHVTSWLYWAFARTATKLLALLVFTVCYMLPTAVIFRIGPIKYD